MTSAAECRKLALDGDRHWPKRRLRTLWRRRRSLAVAALQHLWRGPLATSPRTTIPNSFAQACWAILFISNNTEEPTEHTQMRFELASATLAERIQLGIVAVHEAPEAAAEFLTMDTPQIGASMTTPYLLAATHAARARPVRSPVYPSRTCRLPVKRCEMAAELALAQATRSARSAPTLDWLCVCVRRGRFRQAARVGSGHTRGGAIDASHSVRCGSCIAAAPSC